MRSLLSKGYEVYALAPKDEYSSKLIAEGITFIPIALKNYSMNPIKDIALLFELCRLYRALRFDHIFHYTIKPNVYGSIAAYLSRVPQHVAVTTGLGKMFRFKSKLSHFLSLVLYRLAGKLTDEIWFLNEHDRDVFVKNKITLFSKTRILPSEGININKFRQRKGKLNSNNVRFLFAGRLLFEKGLNEYITAALEIKKRYKHVRIELLGFIDEHNPDAVSIDTIASWQKQGIKYLGSTEDVRPYLDRADCLVFPSYYQEGVSRILLEAASMSTPIITTDSVGCREVVVNEWNGFLCKPKSIESLTKTIEKFLSLSIVQRQLMGDNGRDWVKRNYSEDRIIAIYHQFISDDLKESVTPMTTHTNI
jgi:glycosyltransferase involved in cell wall biosynthesis